MSNNTNILANMSRDDSEIELESIKNINKQQTTRLEEYEQQLYNLKRHLAISKSMEEHYSSEAESLQSIHDAKIEELMKKLSLHEEQITLLHQKHTETIQYYETELMKKDNEIIENMTEIKKSTLNISQKNEEEKYIDEIYELKIKINDLTDEIHEFENKYKDAVANINTLENKNIELARELTELKEYLNEKKVEMKENKDFISNLQDELIIMQREMDNLKTRPVNKAFKGNSLFAEVDDNRVKLQKNVQILKKQFNEMQVKYSIKSQELQKLRFNYDALLKEIENHNKSNDDQNELIKNYKRHFDNLNSTIQTLVLDLEEQKLAYDKFISGDMKFAVDMISVNHSKVLTLQQKLNSESLALAFSEQSHYETKKTLKYSQMEIIRLRSNIQNLSENPVENIIENNIQTIINNCNTSSNTMLTHIDDSLLNFDELIDEPISRENLFVENKENIFVENKENIFVENKENLFVENKENLPITQDDLFIKQEPKEFEIIEEPKEFEIREELKEFEIREEPKEFEIREEPKKCEIKEEPKECEMKELQINKTTEIKKKKIVTFTENTLEPKATCRLGRKVLNVVPTRISNVKKNERYIK